MLVGHHTRQHRQRTFSPVQGHFPRFFCSGTSSISSWFTYFSSSTILQNLPVVSLLLASSLSFFIFLTLPFLWFLLCLLPHQVFPFPLFKTQLSGSLLYNFIELLYWQLKFTMFINVLFPSSPPPETIKSSYFFFVALLIS